MCVLTFSLDSWGVLVKKVLGWILLFWKQLYRVMKAVLFQRDERGRGLFHPLGCSKERLKTFLSHRLS